MRGHLVLFAALTLPGCTVNVNVDPEDAPSPLLSQFEPAQVMKVAAEAAGGSLQQGGGAQGMTRHRGHEFHDRRMSWEVMGEGLDAEAFAVDLRDRLKAGIEGYVKVEGEGNAIFKEGQGEALRQFGFTYTTDAVWGWVDVSCVERPGVIVVALDMHEAQF